MQGVDAGEHELLDQTSGPDTIGEIDGSRGGDGVGEHDPDGPFGHPGGLGRGSSIGPGTGPRTGPLRRGAGSTPQMPGARGSSGARGPPGTATPGDRRCGQRLRPCRPPVHQRDRPLHPVAGRQRCTAAPPRCPPRRREARPGRRGTSDTRWPGSTDAWRAMSSTVVFAVPCRARHWRVASMMRSRFADGVPASATNSRSPRCLTGLPCTATFTGEARSTGPARSPCTTTSGTVSRDLSHCQQSRLAGPGPPASRGPGSGRTTPASSSARTSWATCAGSSRSHRPGDDM